MNTWDSYTALSDNPQAMFSSILRHESTFPLPSNSGSDTWRGWRIAINSWQRCISPSGPSRTSKNTRSAEATGCLSEISQHWVLPPELRVMCCLKSCSLCLSLAEKPRALNGSCFFSTEPLPVGMLLVQGSSFAPHVESSVLPSSPWLVFFWSVAAATRSFLYRRK